jgi:hypothetical protein
MLLAKVSRFQSDAGDGPFHQTPSWLDLAATRGVKGIVYNRDITIVDDCLGVLHKILNTQLFTV